MASLDRVEIPEDIIVDDINVQQDIGQTAEQTVAEHFREDAILHICISIIFFVHLNIFGF